MSDNPNVERWNTPGYSAKKAAELRDEMRHAALPNVAARAGMDVRLAEEYLLGVRPMCERVFRKLQGAIGHFQLLEMQRLQLHLKEAYEEELGEGAMDEALAHAAYESREEEGRAALIVRFSGEEWGRISQVLGTDDDVEACLRAFLLQMLEDDVRRALYCPKFDSGRAEAERMKRGMYSWVDEFDGCRVAVQLPASAGNIIARHAAERDMEPEELLRELFIAPAREVMVPVDDEDCGNWRERALRAEAELCRLRGALQTLRDALT